MHRRIAYLARAMAREEGGGAGVPVILQVRFSRGEAEGGRMLARLPDALHLGTVRAWPARCDGPALIRGCRVETCSGARCSVEVLLHGAPTDTIFG